VLTGRTLNAKQGNWFMVLFTAGALGAGLVMLAGGAAGMPRRFADWAQGGWAVYGDLILVTGLLMAVGLVILAANFMKSRKLDAVPGSASAPEAAE